MLIWLFFLFVYSQSVQQPVEMQKDPHFDEWEILLYLMGLAYTVEGVFRLLLRTFLDAGLISCRLVPADFYKVR